MMQNRPTSLAWSLAFLFRRTSPWLTIAASALLASCAGPKPPFTVRQPRVAPPVAAPAARSPVTPAPALVSQAGSPLEYRQDGARHIYGKNAHRIFKGKMPALMHAVGVLQVELDPVGKIRRLNWMRAPSHAPDVVREIERVVYAAAPFPAPVRLGGVTYTDVWLWDKSGHFQLDTLTEGQKSQ